MKQKSNKEILDDFNNLFNQNLTLSPQSSQQSDTITTQNDTDKGAIAQLTPDQHFIFDKFDTFDTNTVIKNNTVKKHVPTLPTIVRIELLKGEILLIKVITLKYQSGQVILLEISDFNDKKLYITPAFTPKEKECLLFIDNKSWIDKYKEYMLNNNVSKVPKCTIHGVYYDNMIVKYNLLKCDYKNIILIGGGTGFAGIRVLLIEISDKFKNNIIFCWSCRSQIIFNNLIKYIIDEKYNITNKKNIKLYCAITQKNNKFNNNKNNNDNYNNCNLNIINERFNFNNIFNNIKSNNKNDTVILYCGKQGNSLENTIQNTAKKFNFNFINPWKWKKY